MAALGGPLAGAVEDAARITLPNVRQAAEGEPTKIGAELVDPEYRRSFARMERKARQDYQQGYWWRPGQGTPDRAPDLGAALPR